MSDDPQRDLILKLNQLVKEREHLIHMDAKIIIHLFRIVEMAAIQLESMGKLSGALVALVDRKGIAPQSLIEDIRTIVLDNAQIQAKFEEVRKMHLEMPKLPDE